MNSEIEGETLSGGFPENHQDALKQSIYPSIYPQTAPIELLSGQQYRGLVSLAASAG